MWEAIASLVLQRALREAGCGRPLSFETPFLPMNTIFAAALVSSEEPKLFQMFGEACLQISPISEGASTKSCTPSQIPVLMVDSGKRGVRHPSVASFSTLPFYMASLDSPSSEQKEGFFLIFFPLIYFSLRKGGKVWVSLDDQRKRERVAEGKRMNK